MKKHSLPFLLVAVLMLAGALLSGCQGSGNTPAPATSAPAAEGTPAPEVSASAGEPTAAAQLEPYTFVHYFNYDWWSPIRKWGDDEVSKYYQQKFNITVDFQKPDSDAAAKLNLMISGDTLPDSIMMDRGADNINLAKLGKLVDLAPFMEKNKDYEDNVLPQTIDQLKIEGKLYSIPNWVRKGHTGGNFAWIYDKKIWEAAGSPELKTFNDLYNYAKKAKELGKSPNNKDLNIIPAMSGRSPDGLDLIRGFYRSFGGIQSGWYTALNGDYQLVFRDPTFKKAALEANKWFREGLLQEEQFSDTTDQVLEKLVSGRNALLWYDHSQDDSNHYRSILMKTFPGDSYELTDPIFPPAEGVTKIYHDVDNSMGWNVTCITTKAQQPQRIYDLWTSFYTKEGSTIMMYGPKGFNWDSVDANGNPILKVPEQKMDPAEKDKLGMWFYPIPGHSDNVDNTKFAVNDALPEADRSWVITQQAHIFSPQKLFSDEFNGIADIIDPQSDEGIKRRLVEDNIVAQFPKMLVAKSEAEASKLYDEIVKFADDNGLKDVEAKYNEKYKDNVAKYGTIIGK